MTSIDEILKAVDGAVSLEVSERLTTRSVLPRVGIAAGKALTQDERGLGVYDIRTKGDRLSGQLIAPAKFENDPELFYGPFAQLGTYLGIENPALRFVVDAVFDPLNLVLPGTGVLLNRAGRVARVTTAAMHAAESVGKTAKTLDQALDGVEAAVHLANQSPEYLARLRKAATEGVGRREWKSLIDEGLAAEPTEVGKELLGVLRKNRSAWKDVHTLAAREAENAGRLGALNIGEGLVLQPTLRGRLMAGQVNPLFRIERPFARTRQSLTRQGLIGKNSIFALRNGDTFLYTPVSDSFVLGGGKFAEAVLAKTGLQKGVKAVADRVSPNRVPLESVADAGLFQVPVDLERMLRNARMSQMHLSLLLGDPDPRLQDDLARALESPNEAQLKGLAQSWGLDPDDVNMDEFQKFALRKLNESLEYDDIKVLRAAEARQREIVDAIKSGDPLPFTPNEELNEALNAAAKPGFRSILEMRDFNAMASDPGGLGQALHAWEGTTNLISYNFLKQSADVIEAATRRTTPAIAGGRKLERAYREAIRFFYELPELFTKEGDDVYKLSLEKLARARLEDLPEAPPKGFRVFVESDRAAFPPGAVESVAEDIRGGKELDFRQVKSLDDALPDGALFHLTSDEKTAQRIRREGVLRANDPGSARRIAGGKAKTEVVGEGATRTTKTPTRVVEIKGFASGEGFGGSYGIPGVSFLSSRKAAYELARKYGYSVIEVPASAIRKTGAALLERTDDTLKQIVSGQKEVRVLADVPLSEKSVAFGERVVVTEPGELALFERFLERAKENGIPNMEEVLSRQGFMNGMSEVLDMYSDVNVSLLTQASRDGFVREHIKNYFRRTVRLTGKKGARPGVGDSFLTAKVGDAEAEKVGEIIEEAMDAAILADPSLGKAKSPESIERLRRYTERQLVAAERRGKIEFEWDSLAAMADRFSNHRRAMQARMLTDELAPNVRNITKEQLEVMNKHSDFKSRWVPGWLKGVQKSLDAGQVTGDFIPDVARAVAREGERLQPWEIMDEFGFKENNERVFKEFYEKVEVRGGVQVGDDWAEIRRATSKAVARDEAFIDSRARARLLDDLKANPEFSKELGLRRKGGGALSDAELARAVNDGRVPKGVLEPRVVKDKIRKEMLRRTDTVREELGALGKRVAREAEEVWVLKPMAGHLKDAMGLWDKHGFGTTQGIGAFRQWWRDWNHHLKAVKLNLSPFHLNVISFAGLLVDPMASIRILKDPLLKEYRGQLLAKQGIGAAGGAVLGGAMGDDEESAIFGGITGLVFGTAIGAAMAQARVAKNFMFDPQMAPYFARAGWAGWYGRPDDRSIGVIARNATRLSDKIKAMNGGETLASRLLDGVVSVQTDFEKTMWDVAHNGHKMHALVALMQRSDKQLLDEGYELGSKAFLARQREMDRASMQVVNSGLGGFQASKLWNNPEWQRTAQEFLLAPDWTIGNLLGAGNIFLNQSVAKNAAQGAAIGTIAELTANGFDVEGVTGFGALGGAGGAAMLGGLAKRSMARIMVSNPGAVNHARAASLRLYRNAILGGYFFSNLVNYMNTGRWMWENPEGKKLSIAQPGGEYYVSLGKPYTEALEFASAIDRDSAPVPVLSRLSSKISPLGQLVVQTATQTTGLGRPLVLVDQGPLDAAPTLAGWVWDTVSPISLGRPAEAAVAALSGTEREPGPRLAASAVNALGFAVSRERGSGLEAFLPGAAGVTQGLGLGVDLSSLRSPGLGSLSRRNLLVQQRNTR